MEELALLQASIPASLGDWTAEEQAPFLGDQAEEQQGALPEAQRAGEEQQGDLPGAHRAAKEQGAFQESLEEHMI
ncbi:hypothetical protein VF724_08450 [Paenibacillaceae bacterium T2]|uniref:Uncharacterized protein n=1 Tax=Ferviditalea candida TaxID=3108399 RepID=A0ABU5ZK46_9BACL|nr:hypothetical protein [Paenibacillaceae bacterium T2]